MAFVLAVATKLLPIVLAPLFIGRIGVRDAAVGVRCSWRCCICALPRAGQRPRSARCPTSSPTSASTGRCSAALAARGIPAGGSAAVALLAGLGAAALSRRARPVDRSGSLGVADGGRAGLRAGRLPVVPALPHALSLDAAHVAAPGLELQRARGLRRLGHVAARRPMESCRGVVQAFELRRADCAWLCCYGADSTRRIAHQPSCL